MEHLEKEYDFFNQNYTQLIKKYHSKFLVISGESVKGVFTTELDAYVYGSQNIGLGNFILKHCEPIENRVLQTYNNRVIF